MFIWVIATVQTSTHICMLPFFVEQVTILRLYFRELGAMDGLAAWPWWSTPMQRTFAWVGPCWRRHASNFIHWRPHANAYPCPNRFSSCETEHVLRATLAPLSNIFCSPTEGLDIRMPENFKQLRLAPRKIPPYGGFQRKTAAGINYNNILTQLRSQNAFFTPFKHPLPDDSQRGHPIAPNQTAGATSQSWTVGKQRLTTNTIHIIKQSKLWGYCVSLCRLSHQFLARHHLCLLLAPFSLGLSKTFPTNITCL